MNRTGKPKEEEYAVYLSASALKNLPVATTIGNHDSLNLDYAYHFNNPNPTGLGTTQAGGDYYYTYSSGLDYSDTDGMILRTQLTPVFDRYDIDVVLQGHDHTYSRSKILYGDGQTHNAYEFRLNGVGDDYDWDNAYNTGSGEKIPLYPGAEDTAGRAALERFTGDNHWYTIENSGGNSVTNPKGTLYMTANSASGSKYYELISYQQDYIANRSQNWLPSYSVINMTPSDFKITTYQITDDRTVETIDNIFTIHKTVSGR